VRFASYSTSEPAEAWSAEPTGQFSRVMIVLDYYGTLPRNDGLRGRLS
jgi:hypothetical protein